MIRAKLRLSTANLPVRFEDMMEGLALILRVMRVPEEVANDLHLAVTEALTNVLRHSKGECKPLDLDVFVSRGYARIKIVDRGVGYVPESDKLEAPSPLQEGGRGCFLMKTLGNALWKKGKTEGTTVTLTRRWKPPK